MKRKIESKEVRMHLSRPATIDKDGMDGLTYTDNKKEATNVCVWYDIAYKDGEVDMIAEKNFHIEEYKSLENAEDQAYKYADKLSNRFKTNINYY